MTESLPKDARQWGMWCHLSALVCILIGVVVPIPFLGVLVPYLFWRAGRDRHPFIDDQGQEAVNFQLSMSIYLVVAFILWLFLAFITCATTLFIPGNSYPTTSDSIFSLLAFLTFGFLVLFGLFQVCVIIFAATKAYKGQSYQYPFTLRFLQ